MQTPSQGVSTVSLIRQPSALLPLIMSFVALSIVIGHVVMFGIVHEADEGTAAHLFQLLMAGQVPLIVFFASKWLPRSSGPALRILALHTAAASAAFASVFFLT